MENIFTRYFTQNLRKSIELAKKIADKRKKEPKSIQSFDLLRAISIKKGGVAFNLLGQVKSLKKASTKDLKFIEKSKKKENPSINTFSFSGEAYSALLDSLRLAQKFKFPYVGTEHLLFALIGRDDPFIKKVLVEEAEEFKKISSQLDQILNRSFEEGEKSIRIVGPGNEIFDFKGSPGKIQEKTGPTGSIISEMAGFFSSLLKNTGSQPYQMPGSQIRPNFGFSSPERQNTPQFLEYFAHNLNREVISEKVDPVIGREEETNGIIRILMRKLKNNPVLVGEPGVGKTALVSALASKIINREVPPTLTGSVIYNLDLGLLVAGTTFRGEFEERLKNVIEEAENNPNIILFIDEIHNLIGAGNAQGSLDAANILKPALARGLIRCIGATTSEEYKKHIEKDGALERRFQPIRVKEPSLEKTEAILKGIRKYYENFHRVKISLPAIKKAVYLADRFISDRFMPDKAIDLIDETASFVIMDEYQKSYAKQLQKLSLEKEEIEKLKNQIVEKNSWDSVESLLKNEKKLNRIIKQLTKKVEGERKYIPVVNENDVISVLAKKFDLPTEILAESLDERILGLPKALKRKVKGQDPAIKTLVGALQRSFVGIADPERPSVAFLFAGPTGVGKTYLAKVLAKEIFLREDALIRVDMSEFGEKHTASRLIGSPPGYVGYGERTEFMEKVKKNPYSLLLFDEIEKAHPEIFNLFLQILEDGHLTDGTGKKINFKNTIIVFTSNLVGSEFTKKAFGLSQKENFKIKKSLSEGVIRKKLEDFLKPEFINRLTEIVPFSSLNFKDLEQIALLETEKLTKRVAKKKEVEIEVDPRVHSWLAQESSDRKEGVRLHRKLIQKNLEEKIAERFSQKRKAIKSPLKISLEKNQIKIR